MNRYSSSYLFRIFYLAISEYNTELELTYLYGAGQGPANEVPAKNTITQQTSIPYLFRIVSITSVCLFANHKCSIYDLKSGYGGSS